MTQTDDRIEEKKEISKKSLRSLSRTLPQRLGSMSYRDQNEALKKKFNETGLKSYRKLK